MRDFEVEGPFKNEKAVVFLISQNNFSVLSLSLRSKTKILQNMDCGLIRYLGAIHKGRPQNLTVFDPPPPVSAYFVLL